MSPGKARRRPAVPTEQIEQEALVTWLRARGVLFAAVPNGGIRSWSTARALARGGVSAGVPDILVFTPPPHALGRDPYVGCAIELKRQRGGRVSPAQHAWLEGLREAGWYVAVCQGCAEAVRTLLALGY